MPSDNFTMSENSDSFGMQQRQDRFDAIGDLIVGPPGPPGPQGPPGADGTVSFDELTPAQRESLRGEGVPAGGTTSQVLAKASNADYVTEWVDAGGSASMTILSYGNSTWADFIAAYNSNSIVYCRASSAADPSSGSQTRLAFMAYVNNASSPTSVEFQYYRSVSSHSDAQQGDQVYIYKLTSGGVWSVTVREAYTKIVAGTNMSSSYANGTLTLNATGGGGGTSDYDDLTDKPSINNVTLSGNKTAADLSLGTYSKPSGGIPKTDLASAVQTSLGLADSALQAVPSTYRTAAAQDAIDAAQNAEIAQIPRPNLLDNWYFIGGGSQRTDVNEALPINQRGQTTYTGSGFTVDEWRLSGNTTSNFTVSLPNTYDCLRLDNTQASNSNWIKTAKIISLKAGYTYTISCLLKSVSGSGRLAFLTSDNAVVGGSITFDASGLYEHQVTLAEDTDLYFAVVLNSGSTADVYAVKAELGSTQTLAHQENGDWLLNEIPDCSVELLKCQRYLQLIPASSDFLAPIGYGLGYGTTEVRINVPLSTPMVKTPTVTMLNCSPRFYQESLTSAITSYSGVSAMGGNVSTLKYRPYVVLRFTVTGAVNGKPATMILSGQSGSNTVSGILLFAED